MSDSPPMTALTLILADIQRGESELQQIDADLGRLTEKRDATEKRVEAAKRYAALLPPEEAPPAAAVSEPPAVATLPLTAAPKKRRARITSAWQDTILTIVKTAEMGFTFAELRTRLLQSPIKDRMAESTKGYHRALSILAKKKKIVREYGRVFTPAAHKRFEAALKAGDVTADAPQPFAHSPMGTAILKLVQARPGITSTLIIVELRKDPEFNASLTPHQTGAFNIIARLARRKQITRRDDGGLIPGPQFPQELLGQSSDEVGALNGQAASAPNAGRADTLPFENVVGFPRSR